MLDNKIAILPCTGVGQVVGTIARQAAYQVCDDLKPDDTVLVCLPALVKGVQEDIDMIRICPVIVIEGGEEACATYALGLHGGTPTVTISVPKVMRGKGLKIKREARKQLTEPEQAVVRLVSGQVVREIERLCSGKSSCP